MRPETTPELLAQALRFVLEKPSTSYVQRMLGIGYNHACEIMEHFEAEGVISQRDPFGHRKILSQD